MIRRALAVVAVLALLGSCDRSPAERATATTTATAAATSTAPPATTPSTAGPATTPTTAACATPQQGPPTTTLAAKFPTALAFAPDGRLFFTERSGTVRVYQGGAVRTFATVSTTTTEAGGGYSERGLLGLAISPTFSQDRFVYAVYSSADRRNQLVVRWADCAGSGTSATVIIRLPGGSDCCHKGGHIAFGPDGKLYVGLGEEHVASAAQNTSDVRGKVLRYNPDGSVPADNPFGAGNPVWAYGFRNPFGIALSAGGQVAVANNGPTDDAGSPSSGYDTVIAAVARGGGYQWPRCYGYGHPIRPATSCGEGQSGPDWSSEAATVVPTGVAFVDGSGPAGYAGQLVFCTFNRGMLVLRPGSPHATVTSGPSECRLDVEQGPDHALYYADTGHIYRLG
jgi:aldose sugar dehydrogenase